MPTETPTAPRREPEKVRLIYANALLKSAIETFNRNGITFERKSDSHFRVGPYDFWPTTGLFIHRETGKHRRGILNLLIHLRK